MVACETQTIGYDLQKIFHNCVWITRKSIGAAMSILFRLIALASGDADKMAGSETTMPIGRIIRFCHKPSVRESYGSSVASRGVTLWRKILKFLRIIFIVAPSNAT